MIKLTSPGPIFFKQQRSGLNGKPFQMYKFRSMGTDADQRKHELEAMNEMSGPVFKITHDPRITPVGRIDLQRGWRVTAPNLEDCGLLVFDYEGLKGTDSLLDEVQLWSTGFKIQVDRDVEQFIETPPPLQSCQPELREELLRTLLDVLRRSIGE